jgi:hypothetical protein
MARKPNVNDFTGSVNIEGDVTPITRQPVEKVNAKSWGQMTVAELLNQRDILQIRYYRALSVGVGTDAIKEGLKLIDALLEFHEDNDNDNDNKETTGFL